MKKILMPAAALLCLVLMTGGKPATDYRDAYVGSYFCNRNCNHFNLDSHGYINVADTITINISKDALDSIMQIRLGRDTVKAKLVSGDLFPYPDGSNYGGSFFSTDSLNFAIAYGRVRTCNYRGKKQ
jgi:hypothetical protein